MLSFDDLVGAGEDRWRNSVAATGSATVVRPGTDTDLLSAQHFWTGELETAGPGCYDAVAIARAAGFRMLVMSRIRHATVVP
jgi:hypothetical protein